tara:strand:+ start:4197 stop:4400 length:204 start_codon:yes stop_codon:yes gene_type:complete
MKELDYFQDQKHILFGSKIKCKGCDKYPTEIWRVANANHSLINFIFKGERFNNWYCGNCLPPKNFKQ